MGSGAEVGIGMRAEVVGTEVGVGVAAARISSYLCWTTAAMVACRSGIGAAVSLAVSVGLGVSAESGEVMGLPRLCDGE
jgi:hypothetical protein